MQARIKPVLNFCMHVCVRVCDRRCFTTVKKRTTTGVQQRQEQKKEKGQQAKLAIPNVQKICPPA